MRAAGLQGKGVRLVFNGTGRAPEPDMKKPEAATSGHI
jgi:hypothetical protein